ncbi:unnamed protein product, partial [Ectocarpus sp. 6 AP-2014]
MDSSYDEGSQHGSSFEAAFVSSSPFLRGLSSFVRRENAISAFSSEAESGRKPPTLSCLSPEVLARLRFVENAAGRQPGNRTAAAGPTEGRTSVGEQDIPLFSEGGRVEWSRVRISATGDSGVEALADGARLAVACHAALQRHQQQQQRQGQLEQLAAPTSSPLPPVPREVTNERLQMPGVVERIVRAESSKEQVYVALCVCLTILERALYDIYRKGASQTNSNYRRVREDHGSDSTLAHKERFEVKEDAEGIDGRGGSLGAPAMILRDLIATPEVKAALPEQLVAILRLLLLPMGFNVRNLVWHGFLAPCELPRELASLVLVVTLSISADSSPKGETGDVARFGEPPELSSRNLLLSPPTLPKTAPLLDRSSSTTTWWELDSFDNRLACPRALASAVECLLSAQHRDELKTLVRRSAFVLPGREKLTMLALRALGGERDAQGDDDEEEGNGGGSAFFLVAVLPVLEHGLRVLFSCANDSPGHMFAHAQRYYSTLDGFGQRARHQLLLDQEMSGCPDRPNLLLSALGPGMSACLLDLFMMSAGPNLRGKVAHGEVDVSRVFLPSPSCSQTAPELVQLTAALFLVLCRRYDAGRDTVDREESAGAGPGGSSNSFSRAFAEALDECEAHCSGWVPRFHPHELLEVDLRASRDEFDGLALALERRAISVEVLHGSHGGNLARMSVEISGDGRRCDGRTCEEDGEMNREVQGREEEEEEEEEKRDAQPSEGRVVLTVTDTASRLVVPPPPRAPEAVEHDARLPPAKCGATGKLQSKNVQGSTSGMFASLLRVDEALREHGASLARRFQWHQRSVEAPTLASAFAAHYNKQQLRPGA